MVMPAFPVANLVVGQPRFALATPDALFDATRVNSLAPMVGALFRPRRGRNSEVARLSSRGNYLVAGLLGK